MVLMVVLTTTANEYWLVFVVGVHAREDLKYFAAMMVVACNFHFYAFWHATEVVSQASIINTTTKARHRVQSTSVVATPKPFAAICQENWDNNAILKWEMSSNNA